MIVAVLNTEGLNLEHIGKALHWVFLIFPHYMLSSGTQNLNIVQSTYKLCQNTIKACIDLCPQCNPAICTESVCQYFNDCCGKVKSV